jgi:aconitate hydratase
MPWPAAWTFDLATGALGFDPNGQPVYLKDIWPSMEEIRGHPQDPGPGALPKEYSRVFEGDERWQALPAPAGTLYAWDPDSTYIQNPPYFEDLGQRPVEAITDARVLLVLGDSVTTDHISPAGAIPVKSPAGQYLIARA